MADWYGLVYPFIRCMDPEKAHGLAIRTLRLGLTPKGRPFGSPALKQTLWDLDFTNPVGLAAGFDKDAEVFMPMLDQGFGFVEVGSLTPKPQPGNPLPRLFRLTEDEAVINRMGFNNKGHAPALSRLRHKSKRPGPVGVNLGKNKTSEDAVADYVAGVTTLGPVADYLVVNVSSPNTPGLRALQGREPLEQLLRPVLAARDALADRKPPVLLKIAPDLTTDDEDDIAAVALDLGLDGLIISNTTIERPETLKSHQRGEGGGLSGQPLFERSTALLGRFYQKVGGKIPLVGVGGISNGKQAYAKIRAGANLVQLYSALVYRGPGLVRQVNRELFDLLKADGFDSVTEAVGADFIKS